MKKLIAALFIIMALGCGSAVFKTKWTKEIAPETYITRFETTKGIFDIEIKRKWSPRAADRFYQLVKYKYFDNAVFYRVIPDFVAQFGNSDSTNYTNWQGHKVPDEEVILGNTRGTLSFARSSKETRSTDLYINLRDNSRLDTLQYNNVVGFPAFGKVVKGMDVVSELYSKYESQSASKLDVFYADRKKYFEEFPKLDVIQKVYFVKK